MARRSYRLLQAGYYNDNGRPILSYKETPYRFFKRRQKKRGVVSEDGSSSLQFFDDSDELVDYTRDWGTACKTFYGVCFVLYILIVCVVIMALRFKYTRLARQLSEEFIPKEKVIEELQKKIFMLEERMNNLHPKANSWPNYALESQGAKVSHWLSSDTVKTRSTVMTFLGTTIALKIGPNVIIQGNYNPLPGECWPFPGDRGHVVIELSHPVNISHVTVDHISRSISTAASISSAPKNFSVFGLKSPKDNGVHLGSFLYHLDGSGTQTFTIMENNRDVFRYVRLQIESNWGNRRYTCLYGFRVHGKAPD